MIQDIFPHRLWNEYEPEAKADGSSLVICFCEERILIGRNGFPCLRELPKADAEAMTYLFRIDQDKKYFWLEQEPTELPAGYSFRSLKELRADPGVKRYQVFAAFTALQLVNWYRNNRYCGRCGQRTVHDRQERAIRCGCGHLIYPRIVPAVIVGVIRENQMLVTKYRRGFAPFALVAGFTEIGETLEETVIREVWEETGLRVKNIRYYKSQPWGVVDDLLAGFFCDVEGDPKITMDEKELKVAEWRTRDQIELQPDDYSLTNEMMQRFKEGKPC